MRVIDLLALLSDQNKNAPVMIRSAGSIVNIDAFVTAEVQEQPRLILTTLPEKRRTLRLWELRLLLNQPQLRTMYVYVQTPDEAQAIFGFVQQGQKLVLG